MKKIHIIVLVFSMVFSEDARAQFFDKEVFHTQQIGIEAGLGDNSAGGTRFPFGNCVGVFYRNKNYAFGIRRHYFSNLNIFGSANYYTFINGYVGYAVQKKNTWLTPEIGFGYFETDYQITPFYSGVGAEISVDAVLHVRGNGIGARLLYQFNGRNNYVGIIIHITTGWAWNNR